MKKLWKSLAFRIFLLVAVVALVAAGGGVVYLQAASVLQPRIELVKTLRDSRIPR